MIATGGIAAVLLNGGSSRCVVDLTLVPLERSVKLLPGSVLGVLWLQTHFEARHWDRLIRGQTRLDQASAEQLRLDAERAGLRLCLLPAFRSCSEQQAG